MRWFLSTELLCTLTNMDRRGQGDSMTRTPSTRSFSIVWARCICSRVWPSDYSWPSASEVYLSSLLLLLWYCYFWYPSEFRPTGHYRLTVSSLAYSWRSVRPTKWRIFSIRIYMWDGRMNGRDDTLRHYCPRILCWWCDSTHKTPTTAMTAEVLIWRKMCRIECMSCCHHRHHKSARHRKNFILIDFQLRLCNLGKNLHFVFFSIQIYRCKSANGVLLSFPIVPCRSYDHLFVVAQVFHFHRSDHNRVVLFHNHIF